MNTFVDLHHHLLWGMDDGPDSMEDSRRLLRLAAKDGIGVIAATPHVFPGIRPFDRKRYDSRLNALREICLQDNLPIRLIEGAEIHYTDSTLDMLQSGRIPTLGGSRYVLVEFSLKTPFVRIESAAERLFRNGYIPVIAHCERYRSLIFSPQQAIRLRQEIDLCYQVDCDGVLFPRGFWQKRFLRRMFSAGAIDLIATDAHDPLIRIPRMRGAWECLGKTYGRKYADELVCFDLHSRRCD